MITLEITFELVNGIIVDLLTHEGESKASDRLTELFEKHCVDAICNKASFVNAHQFSTKKHPNFKFADLPDDALYLIIDSGLIDDIKNHVKRFNFQVEKFNYNINENNTLTVIIDFSSKVK